MCEEGLLDTSNFPSTHPLYSTERKARLGCIKDEAAGQAYEKWVFLRPKCYSMLGPKPVRRAKGVRRATVRSELTHVDYVACFEEQRDRYHEQRRIGSTRHQLSNMQYVKKSLGFFEDKRYWVTLNSSVPYGHYSLDTPRPNRKRPSPMDTVVPEKRRCI